MLARVYCESLPLKLTQADHTVGFAMVMHEAPPLTLTQSVDVKRWVVEKVAGRWHSGWMWKQAPPSVGKLRSSASARRRFATMTMN